MKHQVFIVKCPDYSLADEKMAELISLMGGMKQFAGRNSKIALKVNLLQPAEPEKAVSTHPAVTAAIAKLIVKEGGKPVIMDSPGSGYPYNEKALRSLYKTCGMTQAAEDSGAELNFDIRYQEVSFHKGKLIKHFEVITPAIESDAVFNICKLKTHLFMSMTGAVKNNFGVIPGLSKPGYHAKLHNKEHFADMLLDLAEYVSPRISIMDAVVGMEGDGPGTAGIPRHVGLLLASTSPLALDVVAGEIIGLKRDNNPVLKAAFRRGLSPTLLEEIEITGPDINELRIPNYQLPDNITDDESGFGHLSAVQKLLAPLFKSGLSMAPKVIREKCAGCGICQKSCPEKVIQMKRAKPAYAFINTRECIRCFCCHELCPEKAIELRGSFLYNLFNR